MSMSKLNWDLAMSNLPDASLAALKNYFIYGLPPGGFLTSVLSNHSWSVVISRADTWNRPILGKYYDWLQECAPPGSWGSDEIVQDWLNKGPAYQSFQKTMVWDILSKDNAEMKDYDF